MYGYQHIQEKYKNTHENHQHQCYVLGREEGEGSRVEPAPNPSLWSIHHEQAQGSHPFNHFSSPTGSIQLSYLLTGEDMEAQDLLRGIPGLSSPMGGQGFVPPLATNSGKPYYLPGLGLFFWRTGETPPRPPCRCGSRRWESLHESIWNVRRGSHKPSLEPVTQQGRLKTKMAWTREGVN